jgi:hypothetical protein
METKDRYTDAEMMVIFGKIMPEENNKVFYAFIKGLPIKVSDKKQQSKPTEHGN